jgi:DNA (cytosine-5)-methyltransferase 1
MNELALFAGAGGGVLAGKLLGWRTAVAVEISGYCAGRLMQRQNEGHLPAFPIWSDICTFDGRPWRGFIDVVSGGFPCTGISPAGKKTGITVGASGLWLEMARVVREVGPRFVYVENSSRLINSGLDRVLSDLASMGFDARWGVLGSNALGADHERKRTWILADSMPWLKPVGWDISGSRGKPEQVTQHGDRKALCKPGFLGKPDGMADRMDRNRAIGNGQDPRVAAEMWRILSK